MEDLAKESDRPVMADRTHSVPPTFRRSPSRPPSRIASRKGFVRDADVTENLAGNADVAVEFKLRSKQLRPPEHFHPPPPARSLIWARSGEHGSSVPIAPSIARHDPTRPVAKVRFGDVSPQTPRACPWALHVYAMRQGSCFWIHTTVLPRHPLTAHI
jgi:hypothetical protein